MGHTRVPFLAYGREFCTGYPFLPFEDTHTSKETSLVFQYEIEHGNNGYQCEGHHNDLENLGKLAEERGITRGTVEEGSSSHNSATVCKERATNGRSGCKGFHSRWGTENKGTYVSGCARGLKPLACTNVIYNTGGCLMPCVSTFTVDHHLSLHVVSVSDSVCVFVCFVWTVFSFCVENKSAFVCTWDTEKK
jgi:hypothetical protein